MSSSVPLVLVHGLGLSGVAAARLLRRQGARVVGVDRRSRLELELGGLESDPGVDLVLGAELEAPPSGTELVVVSPGVAQDHPLLVATRGRGIELVGELELGYRALPPGSLVVAITGSNGKSTTTALTGHLLAAAGRSVEVCGNIGRPLSDCVQQAGTEGQDERVFVVEVSSFQLETTERFRPHAAAILNLSPDHLERHHDLAEYARAKGRLFATQQATDIAVVNAEDGWVKDLPTAARKRSFSVTGAVVDGCCLVDGWVVERQPGSPPEPLFATSDVPLPGSHNLENAMAAALLARALGAPVSALAGALRSFRGLPHRVELVAEVNGVRFVDDSKATNVASAKRSIAGFPGARVHVILGGRAKAGDDLEALYACLTAHAATVLLIGEAASPWARLLERTPLPVRVSETLDRAVAQACAAAHPGDVVLLAPAAASYDQYRNYVERGEHFRRLVEALPPTVGPRTVGVEG